MTEDSILVPDHERSQEWLRTQFHPDGLRCPRCGAEQADAYVFRRTKKSNIEIFRCRVCRQTYSLYSGTVFDGRHLPPEQVVLLLHGIGRNESTTRIAGDLDLSRTTVHEIRSRLPAEAPVPDLDALSPDVDENDWPLVRALSNPVPASPNGKPRPGNEMSTTALSSADARTEDELLICCARAHQDERTRERLRDLLQRPIDWMYLLSQARLHAMLPLLYAHLGRELAAPAPEDMLARLKEEARHIGYRNLRWTDELLRLCALFEERGIRVIVLKGPVLAFAAYGNLGLRPFADLDLLVQRRDIDRATETLEKAGYHVPDQASESLNHRYFEHQKHLCFADAERGVYVELHWALFARGFHYPVDEASLWRNAETVRLGGRSVNTLSREDLVLFLCAHGALHMWVRLLWIADLDALLRAEPRIDWQAVLARARQMRVERMLNLGLYLAMNVSGAPVPAPSRKRIAMDREIPKLAEQVRTAILYRMRLEEEGERDLTRLWQMRMRFRRRVREHVLDRLRMTWSGLCRAVVPGRKDRAFVALPRRLRFLYPFVRPIRLLRDLLLEYPR